ncbi:VCBS repeat-containing protein [Pseudomonas farsensis]|uniref:VCBS repeat-containing protein n=1 Tax=Pseudomonas farsensis TaxID=2745492 RepID=A0ABU8QQP3_9PSED
MTHVQLALALCTGLLTPFASADYVEMPRSEQIKAFKAAGFTQEPTECELEEEGGYEPPSMQPRDINGDGRPDALITESSVYCYGNARTGFYLVSQQADGKWRQLASGEGEVNFLSTSGKDGWPDIEIAGPGFCRPVLRYDGEIFRPHERAGSGCE